MSLRGKTQGKFRAEHLADNTAPLAQLAEQLTLNQWVPGSSPGGRTTGNRRRAGTCQTDDGFLFARTGQGVRGRPPKAGDHGLAQYCTSSSTGRAIDS